jgi:hypothetical protein
MKLYSWYGLDGRDYGVDVVAVMATSYTAALKKATKVVEARHAYDDERRVQAIARLQLQPPRMTSTISLSYYE